LLPPPVVYKSGQILYQNEDLFKKNSHELSSFRGKAIAYIFQDPMSSLNPTMKIGKQILEALAKKSKERVLEILKEVGLFSEKYDLYPHELSGGQRQRAMIAIALAMNPKILIADEPTTALDVTIQAQILKLLKKIEKERKMSIIFISHDLKVVGSLADRILVMYGGRIIEEGSTASVMQDPKHPYTRLLLLSIPKISESRDCLHAIEGIPPDRTEEILGCIFEPRCPDRLACCKSKQPPFLNLEKKRVACWLYHASAS
jgi:oligopeptide transport system ATP-binding protein